MKLPCDKTVVQVESCVQECEDWQSDGQIMFVLAPWHEPSSQATTCQELVRTAGRVASPGPN